MTRRSDIRTRTHTHTQRDTNCVHWAKSEINQAAPEERINYVCQRSFNSAIGTNQTFQHFSIGESSSSSSSSSSSFCLLYLHQMTISHRIEFQIGIRRETKHTHAHTWIVLSSSLHQLVRTTNDDDWHTDCVVPVSNLHPYVCKQQIKKKKKNFALPFVLMSEWIRHSRTIMRFFFSRSLYL